MHPLLKFRCDRVRGLDGIVQVFLTKENGPPSQDETAIFNLLKDRLDWVDGQYYWISIEPAFPHIKG
jgi:hypothetical protein